MVGVAVACAIATGACRGSNGADVTSSPAPSIPATATQASEAVSAAGSGTQPAQTSSPPRLAASEDTSSSNPVPPSVAGGAVPYNTSLYYEVGFAGRSYLCQRGRSIDTCAIYLGGVAPAIGSPDLFCDPIASRCSEYDPSRYEEVSYAGANYLCSRNPIIGGYDCVTYSGGPAPSFVIVDVYCSGLVGPSECSPLWYPDELGDYDLVTIDARDYLCRQAFTGRPGDLDCYSYGGGDPSLQTSGFADLYCSYGSGGFGCDPGYYPSEWEGFELLQIDFADYVCTSSFEGQECFRWYGTGSPAEATFGPPDYYCNTRGCSPDGYP